MIPQSATQGEKIRGSANLNQCPLVDGATSLGLFILFFFFTIFLENLPAVCLLGSPWSHFSIVSESVLSQTSGFLHQCLAFSTPLSPELVLLHE